MKLLDFIKDKDIDGNLYLIKDNITLNEKQQANILGINITTHRKRKKYLIDNNIELDNKENIEIPKYIFNYLDIPYLVKVWLLYNNGIVVVKDIIKLLGMSSNPQNTAVITTALNIIAKGEGREYIEQDIDKMKKEDIANILQGQWGIRRQ